MFLNCHHSLANTRWRSTCRLGDGVLRFMRYYFEIARCGPNADR